MRIKIPFRIEFMGPIREGKKIMTSRSEPMGEIGDTFEAFGLTFEIEEVFQARLKTIANSYFRWEGVQTPDEFIEVWKKIHPIRGFDPEHIVYVHRFTQVIPQKPEPEQ